MGSSVSDLEEDFGLFPDDPSPCLPMEISDNTAFLGVPGIEGDAATFIFDSRVSLTEMLEACVDLSKICVASSLELVILGLVAVVLGFTVTGTAALVKGN